MSEGKSWSRKVNPVVRNLPPSGIRKFFDLIQETEGVISLGVGEPDFVTPWGIREACVYALGQGYTAYSSNAGLLQLRRAISRAVEGRYGVKYDPATELLVTVGVSEALDLALRSLLQPGEEVIIPEPCYVSYAPCTTLAGGNPVLVPTSADDQFKITPDRIEKAVTKKSKVLLLCYPNNPTGAVMTRDDLLAVAEIAKARDLIVFSDEIYDRLTYRGEHTCMSSLPGMRERTVLLNGFSKAYAMTGWRVGYAAGNPDFIGAMTKIHQYSALCAPITAQMAALEALRNGETAVVRMVREYDRRRQLILTSLRDMGLPCFEPLGAFYIFPEIRPSGMNSEEFAEKLLKEEKVALVPGNAFGPSGEGFVRCAYAASLEDITEAMRRLAGFVRRCGVRAKQTVS